MCARKEEIHNETNEELTLTLQVHYIMVNVSCSSKILKKILIFLFVLLHVSRDVQRFYHISVIFTPLDKDVTLVTVIIVISFFYFRSITDSYLKLKLFNLPILVQKSKTYWRLNFLIEWTEILKTCIILQI